MWNNLFFCVTAIAFYFFSEHFCCTSLKLFTYASLFHAAYYSFFAFVVVSFSCSLFGLNGLSRLSTIKTVSPFFSVNINILSPAKNFCVFLLTAAYAFAFCFLTGMLLRVSFLHKTSLGSYYTELDQNVFYGCVYNPHSISYCIKHNIAIAMISFCINSIVVL